MPDRARRPRRCTRSGSPSCAGRRVTVRVPQRGDKRALQETVTRNAKEEFARHRLQAGVGPQQPGPGAQRAAGRARPARGAAAHRVLRHEPHPGHRLRRLDGGDGGRPPEEERVPPVQGAGRAGQRRLRRHGGGAHPPAHRLPRRAGPAGRASGRASSPTRRSCCSSTAARASSAWPSRCSRSSASTTRSRWRRWPSGSRRSTCPGEADPIRIPRQSEALYLLQRIRDEAHRFAITYHRQLRDKRMTKSRARRHPRPRPDPQEAPVKELGGVNAVKQASLEELQALPWLPDDGGRGRLRQDPRPGRAAAEPPARPLHERRDRRQPHVSGRGPVGGHAPAGGRTGSPRAPTPSTPSRSCRWPPSTWPGPRDVLDVGTGEGQVARLAAAGGAHRVVGVDPTVGAARRPPGRGPAGRRTSGAAPPPCPSPDAASTPSSPASSSSTSRTARTSRAGGIPVSLSSTCSKTRQATAASKLASGKGRAVATARA